MNAVISELPILVLNVHSRCNCRCGMCDIWKVTENREMPVAFVEQHLDEFMHLGVKWVVLTGGEPLMHSDLFSICDSVRRRGMRVTVLTSGLLMARFAADIARYVDDLIVSIDGPPEIHDRIRGIPGGFDSIGRGISEVRSHSAGFVVSARCTVQKANHARLLETIRAARIIGVDSVSFLAVDIGSSAFNRVVAWPEKKQNSLVLSQAEIDVLEREVEQVAAHPMCADSRDHLNRVVERFRAYAGMGEHKVPRCNAPWVSAVVEVDGRIRPCFFHEAVATVNGDFAAALNSREATQFRSSLDIATNETCRRCVCSLFVGV